MFIVTVMFSIALLHHCMIELIRNTKFTYMYLSYISAMTLRRPKSNAESLALLRMLESHLIPYECLWSLSCLRLLSLVVIVSRGWMRCCLDCDSIERFSTDTTPIHRFLDILDEFIPVLRQVVGGVYMVSANNPESEMKQVNKTLNDGSLKLAAVGWALD